MPTSDASQTPYTIVIPPPNVTGVLHMGHALNNTLQDILVRWRRMVGDRVLWLPGMDHAGIATQSVVERSIFKAEGKNRHDLGRDELVRRIWAWKEEHGGRIIEQLRRIGSSCDWSRTRFTLDDMCAQAVRCTFFRLFADRKIYRGKRLVNWDTQLQTAVADDEVYHEAVQGHLWYIRYPIVGSDEHLLIATTRPETMLGDTAVAVHPDDANWNKFIGKQCRLPLMNREIPIIGDKQLVDPEFGTGCVKVTPAHDPNDYACGERHDLPQINILTPDGRINEEGGEYQGLERYEARQRIVDELSAQGLLERVEDHEADVGHSDRSKTPIEPYLSDQWFVVMDQLAQGAMEAVTDGRVQFHPKRYAKGYLDWLGEKRDWCISRQLWWGHRIPIWYCDTCTLEDIEAAFGNSERTIYRYDDEHQTFLICSLDDLSPDALGRGHTLEQDPDVLDTWFSSALWPHSTLGWPEQTEDLQSFYPTNALITSRDIITLWVARMVMMGLYNMDAVPFSDVVVHPKILDGQGRTMSKSLGNGVDPLDIISWVGADAMRFTLAHMTTETQDIRMPVEQDDQGRNISARFEQGRNFANKLWNAARLVFQAIEDNAPLKALPPKEQLELHDRWILSRLQTTIQHVTSALEQFRYGEMVRLLYDFAWGEYCDWYLESVKPRWRERGESGQIAVTVALTVLDQILRMLHPVMPFVTEEIWQQLPSAFRDHQVSSIMLSQWPVVDSALIDEEVEQGQQPVLELIGSVRNERAQLGISAQEKPNLYMLPPESMKQVIQDNKDFIALMTNSGGVIESSRESNIKFTGMSAGIQFRIDYEEDPTVQLARVQAKITAVDAQLKHSQQKLDNKQFIAKAPQQVVAEVTKRHDSLKSELTSLNRNAEELKNKIT